MAKPILCICLFFAAFSPISRVAFGESPDAQGQELLALYTEKATKKWQKEIDELLRRDQHEQPDADSVLFIGSSSIRLWDHIAKDVAPYKPINRGYGGAKFSDLAVFAKALITPHQYRAIVIFVANDVTGSKEDISAEEVERLAKYVCDVSLAHQPEAPVLIVEITPTPSRFSHYAAIRSVNDRLRGIALTTPGTHFIATAEDYLDAQKQPRGEYFVEDKLHQNQDGYVLWGRLIKRRLDEVLGP